MTRKYPPAVSSATSAPQPAHVARRYARAVVELPAQYSIDGADEWKSAVIDNVGGGGVRLQTREDVAAGTVVGLRFEIDGSPVSATARIAMSLYDAPRERYVHGAAFTAIAAAARATIVARVGALHGETPGGDDT